MFLIPWKWVQKVQNNLTVRIRGKFLLFHCTFPKTTSKLNALFTHFTYLVLEVLSYRWDFHMKTELWQQVTQCCNDAAYHWDGALPEQWWQLLQIVTTEFKVGCFSAQPIQHGVPVLHGWVPWACAFFRPAPFASSLHLIVCTECLLEGIILHSATPCC